MSRIIFQARDGELRIGDANGRYVKVIFEEMDLNAPIARSRGIEETVPTVGGGLLAPTGPGYDEAFFAPVPIELSFSVNSDDYWKMRQVLSNPDINDGVWTVGQNTWSSTKGRGSIIMPDLTYRATPAFDDQAKVATKVETLWTSRISGSVLGMSWDETYFPPQNLVISETPDKVNLKVQGLVYGNIRSIGAFTLTTEQS